MSDVKTISHKKFDGDWKFQATPNGEGGIKSADIQRVIGAQLVLIRDSIREGLALQREQNKILRAISRKLARKRRRKVK